MKIIYICYTNLNKKQAAILNKLGTRIATGYSKIEIEKGEQYYKIEPFLREWGCLEDKFVGTYYNKKELDAADLLEFSSGAPIGYPQPEYDDWNGLTYDLSENCSKCDVGKTQKEPFRIKRIPDPKKKTVSLEWVYDELFVTEELYYNLFKPLNIEYWPILLYKKETIIPGWVQLKIPITDASLRLDNQRYELCSECGRKKYINQIEGLFPEFIDNSRNNNMSFFKSREYFGSGGSAFRLMFIDQKFRKQLIDSKIKAQYRPVNK